MSWADNRNGEYEAGFGTSRVRSPADRIARVLTRYLERMAPEQAHTAP